MKSINDDDFDGPGREFSLPSEIVKVPRPARVNMRQSVPREIAIPTPSAGSDLDLSVYLHSLRRNWLLGALLGLFCSVPLAALAYSLMVNQYTATEYLRVSSNHTPLVFENKAEAIGRSDIKNFKNTQRQLMLQPFVLNKALKDSETALSPLFKGIKDPIAWLQKELKVTFPDEAEIMNVSLQLPDPVIAHKIVKAVVDTYLNDVVAKEKSERLDRVERLERILIEAEDKVRKKRNELSNIVETLGTGDSTTLNLAQQGSISQFALLRSELSKISIDLMRAKGEFKAAGGDMKVVNALRESYKLLEQKKPDLPADSRPAVSNVSPPASEPTSTIDSRGKSGTVTDMSDVRLLEQLEKDIEASQLKKEVEHYEKSITSLDKRYDPKIAAAYATKYQAKLDEAKQKLAERTKRVQQLYEVPGATALNRSENLPLKIVILESQEAQLREEMKALESESKKFGRSSIDVEMKRKEITGLDPVVEKVSLEIEQTRIELQSASRITPLATTGIPAIGENKKRLPATAGAGLAGLFLPICLLVLLDSRRNHVNSLNTINDGLKLTVLGSIPRVPARLMRRLNDPANTGAKNWRARISESVSAIVAMLLRKLASEGHRVIMISSAVSGEGKSTLSEQLGRGLADSGHRTLLIDFDLRRPTLHYRFDAPLEPGVSEVLRHGADLMQTIRPTDSPNLFLLTAGNCAGSLLLESANGTLESLINQCRTEFEIVLVDSSPLLPVVDGRLIGQHTDGAILTIVKDTSQVPQVSAARKILNDYGIAVLGCVFTGDPTDGYYGGNGTYGSYGSSPGSSAPALENKQSRPTSAM